MGTTPIPEPRLSVQQFALKLKGKYPQYQDLPDEDLVRRIVDKYPEYQGRVELGTHEGPGTVSPPKPQESFSASVMGETSKYAGEILASPYTIGKAVFAGPQTPEEEEFYRKESERGDWIPQASLASKRLLADPMMAAEERAREAASRGDTAESMLHSAAAPFPFLNSIVGEVNKLYKEGNETRATTRAVLEILTLSLGSLKVRGAVKGSAGAARKYATGTLDARRARLASQEIADVANATPKKYEALKRDIGAALPDIAESVREKGLKLKGNERVAEFRDLLDEKADKIWNEGHKPMVERQAQAPVDNRAIAREVSLEIAPEDVRVSTPAAIKASREWISQMFDEPMNVTNADGMIRRLNAELRNPPEAFGEIGKRVREVALKELRKQLDYSLESHGEVGVRDLNRRWGAMNNISETISNRIKAADLKDPPGLSELVHRPWRTIAGSVAGGGVGGVHGAGIGATLGMAGDVASLIRRRRAAPGATAARAGRRLSRTSLRSKSIPAHEPVTFRGLLTEGNRRMPSGEPGGPSGVKGLEAESSVVRDPKTGRFKRVYSTVSLQSLMKAH